MPMSSVKDHNRPPLRSNILTVVMPGVTCTRAQISRYTAEDGVTVLRNDNPMKSRNADRSCGEIFTTAIKYIFSSSFRALYRSQMPTVFVEEDKEGKDEEEPINEENSQPPVLYHAFSPIAPRIIHNVMASPEIDEISYRWSWNPLHWLMGIKDRFTMWWFATHSVPRFYAHCEIGGTSIGGSRDQLAFQKEVRRAVVQLKDSPSTHLVLFGWSRGGATCFYSSMKLPQQLASRVSLVIVESPFDNIDNVMNTSCWFPSLMRWGFQNFCDYRGDEEAKKAYSYDPDKVAIRCPVAFVISLKDTRVPNTCSEALIDSIRRDLVPHKIPAVEVLVLKHSRHPVMPVGCQEDQDAYVQFVEMLYNKYCT